MYKFINTLIFFLILLFLYSVFRYYSSNNNIQNTSLNRSNIDQILEEKISGLPILGNNTNNVIEFNDSFSNEIDKEKNRNFWDLLKSK